MVSFSVGHGVSKSTSISPASPSFPSIILSPPPSPLTSFDDDFPITPTDEQGMILDDVGAASASVTSQVRAVKEKRPRKPRRQITYVSRHFTCNDEDNAAAASASASIYGPTEESATTQSAPMTPATPPQTPAKCKITATRKGNTTTRPPPRIYNGLSIDSLSSDSSLTSLPSSIGPSPFPSSPELLAIKTIPKKKKKSHPTKSPYFPSPSSHKNRPHFLSALPFPPLSAPRFGLMQEKLAHDPFRLLIATIFLNKTPGERAMPVFYRMMEKYPTPEILAEASVEDITNIIRALGFQNQRARKIVGLARGWVERKPERGRRFRKLNYPRKGDGRDVKDGEVLGPEEEEEEEGRGKRRVGWEISHLPGLGPYSHDSWRMFCRDMLLGRAEGWNGKGVKVSSDEERREGEFEPEWKRVLPLDKELRAWMTWMWLKEGWLWNKETSERTRASEELMQMARGGGVVVEEGDKDVLTLHPMSEREVVEMERSGKVERSAGEVLDETSNS